MKTTLNKIRQPRDFCLKSEKWYTETFTKTEFNNIRHFLHGSTFCLKPLESKQEDIKIVIVHDCDSLYYYSHPMERDFDMMRDRGYKEIKFKTEIRISEVIYPELPELTPEQVEISSIESEMKKLTERLSKLKGN